ncbi:MAG: hypothetical protein KC619_34465 [Myxococcales bacterium]|nr:hypothetical protein [Myxococcales bacterium]
MADDDRPPRGLGFELDSDHAPPPSKSAVTKAADDEGSDPEKMSLGELLRRLKLGSAVRLAVGLGAAFVVVAGAGWRVGYWQRGVEREAGEAEAQRTTRAPEANAPSARRGAIDTISDGSEPSEEVEEVRTANGVSLIESAEAELPVDELPAGRYGFCIPWIGLQEGLRCTVRAQRLGSDVEIHKLPSGEVRVLLFASPERALELRQGRAARGVFYPSARPEAPDLVQIPSRLIRSIRSRRWGLLTDPDAVNMFDVEVEAAHGRGG